MHCASERKRALVITVWTGFEIVGTIAFAATGAIVAIRKEFDLFGVLVLATITAVGGGMMRDIIIGNLPPMAFRDSSYIIISLLTALIVSFYYRYFHRYNSLLQIFDAIGLGAFTATSANIAIKQEWQTLLLVLTVSVLAGAGGGVIRDVLAGRIPLIFQKEIYALASIVGAAVMYFVYPFFPNSISLYLCFFTTVVIRLICLRLDIHLPVVRPRGFGQ